MCEPGYYNPSLNAEECIACEAGTINNEYAGGISLSAFLVK